ncbi:RNA-directed DNA polymerase domain protein [Bacillus cereus]|nr:RNA-directed DNA polymerase domain protein [Bacillus cereus]
MSWIKIERHNMVKFKNSPDDPTLKEYWEKRDRKVFDTENSMDRMKLARNKVTAALSAKLHYKTGKR